MSLRGRPLLISHHEDMKMWRKELTLMLLTVAVMVISGEDPVILNKTKHTVLRPSGSSLTLGCSLDTEKYERFRLFLYCNPSGPSFTDSHQIYEIFYGTKNHSIVFKNERQLRDDGEGNYLGKTVLKYTLLNATETDSGWYFCKVIAEIPDLANESSSGTEIIIKTVAPPVHLIDWWLWLLVGVFAVILIVLLLVIILMRRRRNMHRAMEDPIYANTHRPSPRPGIPAENLKTVSSSQNLRHPSTASRYENGKRRQNR
ncbi:uncharacterized protein LOC117804706 isoform X2 [Notolabrus celidotus]|uniref:uncharacterized protein LOC117804706 isoform X2 n=1 Tax=Notolabrus celidotus TaxID=1203425 RepID=UPI0014906404|nr:uncharacterized protein LOC117804706 isoform X2 [Notolabrus celidotus]